MQDVLRGFGRPVIRFLPGPSTIAAPKYHSGTCAESDDELILQTS